jgi:hypothetical protein
MTLVLLSLAVAAVCFGVVREIRDCAKGIDQMPEEEHMQPRPIDNVIAGACAAIVGAWVFGVIG